MDRRPARRRYAVDDAPTLAYQRLITFSDAVFAIAATLLVIDLRPPQTSSDQYEMALRAYLSQPGPFIATTIGFVVVGSFWSSHRRTFALLRDTSGGVLWANLVFLFGVAVQPFLTAALAEHDPNRTSVVLYASGQLLTCLAQLAVWAVALRSPELLTERASPDRIRYVWLQLLRAPATFALSIPITLAAGPAAGMASWVLMVAFAIAIGIAFRHLDTPEGEKAPTRRGAGSRSRRSTAEVDASIAGPTA